MGFLSVKWIKKIKCLLISKFLELRPVTIDDCKNIYNWRNHELNRKYSLNSETIEWESHQNWFKGKLNNQQTKILIAKYLGNEIGVIIFDFHESYSEISIYLVPGRHNKGYGLSLLYAAESWLKSNYQLIDIQARILPNNQASVSVFTDAGYEFMRDEKNYQLWKRVMKK